MSSSLIRANIIRFVVFVLIQGFVLKGVDLKYIDVYLYPLFILMLPTGLTDGLLLLICFLLGVSVDVFYNTLGLHASAAVFAGGVRPFALAFLEPRGGYDKGKALTKNNLGASWFLQYAAIVLFFHTFWVALIEDLHLSWMWFYRLVAIFVLSLLLAIIYQYIFNPKE